MKPAFPVLLIFLILCIPDPGYSQKNYDQARHDKKFSRRNTFYSAYYKGNDGRNGWSGINLIFRIRGSDGKPGGEGPCLQITVYSIPSGDSAVLAINITKDGDPKIDHYYVNPRRGKITISSDGGNGGVGGNRTDGSFHNGYNGGNGGMGGTINITFDSSALPYVDCQCIVALNRGGWGGKGGEGGKCGDRYGSDGGDGVLGASGPPVYIKDPNGKVLKTMITN